MVMTNRFFFYSEKVVVLPCPREKQEMNLQDWLFPQFLYFQVATDTE